MEIFKHIGLMGRPGDRRVLDSLVELDRFLTERGIQVSLEESCAQAMPESKSRANTIKLIGETCDLAIVVGGDGSLLGAARELASYDIPLLGVNRGKLGFLTDILPEELIERVSEILAGEYRIENRFLLKATLTRDGEPVGTSEAVNDVVLDSGGSARMMEYELYIDEKFVYSLHADGLIVSTPTGSTAYALSGGGPIMHPSLDAVVLVPLCPHTLSSRPIVVSGDSEIKIIIGKNNPTDPQMNCDGQVNFSPRPGDVLYVRKRRSNFKLIHPKDHNYYAACREKLGWGNRLASVYAETTT